MINNNPPRLPLRFFHWYCHPDYQEDIEGDLLERFEVRVQEKGYRKAKWGFTKDVIRLFRPGIIRPLEGQQQLNNYDMFKSYFKITWRSLLKQKLYSFINIGGLSIGITCFILIFLYVQHELSYDKHLENTNQIHRIYKQQEGDFSSNSDYSASTPAILASTLVDNYEEVLHATSIKERTALLSHGEDHYLENGLWADAQFFNVFRYSFIAGNPQTSLENKQSVVLTQSLAQKIFNQENPIGQLLSYQNGVSYTITGIIKDHPINSSFKWSFITSLHSNQNYVADIEKHEWENNSFLTFFSLQDGANSKTLEGKLSSLLETYRPTNDSYPFKDTYFIQPLSEIHLETKAEDDIGLKGNPKYITLFSLIALLVLLLACINYMNLAIARSVKRAREVGLRKTIGAARRQLIIQFLGESILIAFLALVLALGLAYWLTPIYGHILERPLELDLMSNVLLLPALLFLVIIVGIFSGSYPAFFMSSLNPIEVLKGKIDGLSGMCVQRWLIVGQYTTSIILVISSLVIYHQFQFIQDKELGYEKEHVITIPIVDRKLQKSIDVLKNEWINNSNIISASASSELPSNIESSTIINDDDRSTKNDDLNIHRVRVDYDFLDVFRIKMIAGRNFSPDRKADWEESYLLNETAAKILGWSPKEAIGKQFTHDGTETVIGVVKDFHIQSMYSEIKPLMIRLKKGYYNHLSVKVRSESLNETLVTLENDIKKYSSYPFEYEFLDDQFDQLYKADIRLGKMFGFFTLLSIFIASLGLFGLAAFSTKQRIKEIGIRKVLGASVRGIVGILSIDFLKLVIVGFLIAAPIAWYIMEQWLTSFAYRIEIKWWMFVFAGAFTAMLSLFTISSQSIKAALSNPVDSLKNE